MSNPYEAPAIDGEINRRVEEILENRELRQRLESLEQSQRRWKWITIGLFVAALLFATAWGMYVADEVLHRHEQLDH